MAKISSGKIKRETCTVRCSTHIFQIAFFAVLHTQLTLTSICADIN